MYQYICNDIIRSYDSACRLHLCWHLGLQPFPSLFLVLRPLESKSACCWHCRKNPDLRNPLVLKCAQVKCPSKKRCQVRLMGLVVGTYMTCLFVWRFWTLNSYQFEEKYESNSKFLKFYRPLILNSSGFSYLPPHILHDFIMGFPHFQRRVSNPEVRSYPIDRGEVDGRLLSICAQRWHHWFSQRKHPKVTPKTLKRKIIWTKPPWLWVPVNFPGCFFRC